jgi:drug/metabolite transporter (DMT)-like permease
MSEPVAIEAPSTDAGPVDERGTGPVAIAMLVIGFGLAAAAQYLPWSTIDLRRSAEANPLVGDGDGLPASIDIDLANLGSGHVVVYLSTLVLALAAIGVLVVTQGTARRAACAAAVALLAGNALILVGFNRPIDHLAANLYASSTVPDDVMHIGAGYPLAAAATAMLAAGAIVALRGNLRPSRRRPVEDPHDGSEPLELSVTPLQ